MKNTPGPLAPPDKSRPRRNITARSYSLKKKKYFGAEFPIEIRGQTNLNIQF